MKVTLKLRFGTTFGQSLWVTGDHPLLGDGDAKQALPLHYLNPEYWEVTLDFTAGHNIRQRDISYHYIIRQPDGSQVADWAGDRAISPALLAGRDVVIVDSWNFAGFPQNVFYTEPFQKVLLRDQETLCVQPAPERSTHTFRVKAPLLAPGETLALLGSAERLGRWDTSRPVLLNRTPGESVLTASLDLSGATFPIECKYGIFDTVRRVFVRYEDGDNRRLDDAADDRRQVIFNDGFARLPADTWKGAGVAIPVFSLRSQSSFGVGEFSDLKLLADWCNQTGLKLIQILPVNDTTATNTWADSYPYAAISAFALHPIYLNLRQVAARRNQALLTDLEPERNRLNALPQLDYAAVMRAKLAFLERIYPSQKAATFRCKAYREFFAANRHWLQPYAAFCCLRDRHGTADTSQWPAHQRCTPEDIAALTDPDSADSETVGLHYFIQFHLHSQLLEAVAHAHARGVILKGDIAIGVSRHGVDTWQQPELYDLTLQAGAPPDPFAQKGQNWGFPTYNWQRMTQDGFAWWKQRFAQMGNYFDAFRIDHILGFFRIWSIPLHAVEGILGRFVPAIPVEPEEFTAHGIDFDRARFVEPFITDPVLAEVFGADAEWISRTFLQPAAPGRYALRLEFATQRQVEQHFAALGPTPQNERLKMGLFDLISNVLLLEVEGSRGPEYHFRFHVEQTASFRQLDPPAQGALRDLYVDYFFRRQEEFWREQAMQKLPALKRVTDMLICGEDLGVVPACVPEVMRDLGLLSLEVQRMPKTLGQTFSRPSAAPYLSVVTPSTHDMSTIRGWWTEDASVTQRFYNEELGLPGPAPARCSGELNEAVVKQHLASPAMWSLFQLQDLLGSDETLRHPDTDAERINIPAHPKHYWRYRMHLTLEMLLHAATFNGRLKSLLAEYAR